MEPAKGMPAWLDRDYMQSLLRENAVGLFVVDGMEVTSAVAKGENYASELHRVAVSLKKGGTGKAEQHYLIIKSLPASEMFQKILMEGGIFERELRMYSDTLPTLHRLETNSNKSPVVPFFCNSYKTSRPYTIVMEDISKKGYKVANRHKGLDLNHSKLAMKTMARLHALSLGQLAEDPTFMDPYVETMMTEEKKSQTEMFILPTVNMLASKVEEWPGYERFGARLRSINWTDRITELFKIGNGIAVLNHGDGWVNNMMFKYTDRGDVEDMKFVDYQMCRYASPGIDIQYFMHTSPREDVREQHWDALLDEYHKTFVQTLRSVGGDPKLMSFAKLKKEVDEKLLYGVWTACAILPIVLADAVDAPDMSALTDSDIEKYGQQAEGADFGRTYGAPRFRAAFQKLLRSFEERGIL